MFILGGVQLALLHCTFSHFVIENKTYLSLVGFGLSNNTNSKRCDPAHLKYVVEVTPHVSASWATETPARLQICCRYTRESESDIDSNQLCTRLVQYVHKTLSIKKGAFSPEDKSSSVTLTSNTQKHKIVAHQASCHRFVLLLTSQENHSVTKRGPWGAPYCLESHCHVYWHIILFAFYWALLKGLQVFCRVGDQLSTNG